MQWYYDKQHDVLIYPARYTPNPTYLPEARPINGSWFGVKRTLRKYGAAEAGNSEVLAGVLDRLREAWRSAPVQSSLKGARIRIAGFVVPIERQGDRVTEFLLVPYFGACIHVPPPPANQIIYVIPSRPLNDVQTMDAFWVSGTLDLAYADSPPWGASGYRMKADIVTPYTNKR